MFSVFRREVLVQSLDASSAVSQESVLNSAAASHAPPVAPCPSDVAAGLAEAELTARGEPADRAAVSSAAALREEPVPPPLEHPAHESFVSAQPNGDRGDIDSEVPGPTSAAASHWLDDVPPELRARQEPRVRGRRLAKKTKQDNAKRNLTPTQRLLLLDSWRRSGLPAGDFAALVGISKHTLYAWKKQFDLHGPEGLLEQPRAKRKGGRLPELTKRTILMLKESHPEWGCQRISDMLTRGPALPACATSVASVLHEAGYEVVDEPTRPHPDKIRHFERAEPNQLWQTDLFT